MSQVLIQVGICLLNVLGCYSELIMQVYVNGVVDEVVYSKKIFE